MRSGSSTRSVLASVAVLTVVSVLVAGAVPGTGGVAVAGATGDATGGADEASHGAYVVETSDGAEFCTTPVEGQENVSAFYGYNTGSADSRGGETGFEEAGTASLLLYRSADTGNLSLVFLQGSQNESDLRRADYRLSGFEGAAWIVRDDPESFAYDTYEFDDGTPTAVNWRWQSGTDGGALGPLGEEFDVSVEATTHQVDTWRVIAGNGSVAGTAPVGGSVRIRTAGENECSRATATTTADPTATTAGTDGADGESSSGQGLPGFGVLVALLGLAGLVGIRRVRR